MSLQKIKPQYIDLTQSFAGNLTVQGNISSGNINVTSGIYSANYYFANGDPFTSSNYGNTEVGSYLETYSGNLTANNITVNGNFTVVNYEYVNTTEFANLQTATTVNAQTIGNTGATLIGNINGTVWGPLNGTIGDTIANSGVFTTLTATTGYQGNTNGAHNGTVGVTTPNSGAFTTLTASSTLDVSGIANFAETINAATLQASTIGNIGASIIGTHNGPVNGPINGTIGATTPNTGAFTTLTTSSTANVGNLITSGGVFWPNGSSYTSSTTGNVNPSLYLGNVTVSTTATLIDTLPVNGNTLVRWSVIANDSVSSKYRSGIIDSINDASDVYYNEYAVIKSSNNDNVVVLTSNISAGNINLYGVGDSAAVYVQFERLALGTGSAFGFLNIGPVGPTGSVANTSGYIVTTNTDPSTSTTTGALQVAGGVGILGNLYVGGGINGIIGNGTAAAGTFSTLTSSGVISASGNIHANSNTASTSQTTGAFVVTGGLGVSGTANVGNVITSSGVYYANGTAYGTSTIPTQQIFTYTAPTGTFARAASMNGSHTRVSTTLTVSLTNHNFIAGDRIYGDITSGTVADQWVTVATVPNANAFTCTIASASGSAGNSTWYPPIVITANGHGFSTNADVYVDFNATFSDAYYTVYQATTNTFQVESGTTATGSGTVSLPSQNSVQTYTKPTNCRSIWVRVVGGGGAGTTASLAQIAGAGYAEEIIDVTAVSTVSVTVGRGSLAADTDTGTRKTGGTSSFGAYLSATGSNGSGTAGSGVGGTINIAGTTPSYVTGGTSKGFPGVANFGGGTYGIGGTGSYDGCNYTAGNGGHGIVIVWEYY